MEGGPGAPPTRTGTQDVHSVTLRCLLEVSPDPSQLQAVPLEGRAPRACPGPGLGLIKPSHPQRGLTYAPSQTREIPAFPQSKQTPVPTPCLKGKGSCPVPCPSLRDSGKGPSGARPPLPPPRGPWCMLQSMQFLCLFCLLFSQWGVGGGQRWEWGAGSGGLELGSQRRLLADPLLAFPLLASPQTTTVGTTVMRPAAATPVPAPSSSVTADAASLSTGPAMGTTTVGTTATRHTPTAPTRVGAWGQQGGGTVHVPGTQPAGRPPPCVPLRPGNQREPRPGFPPSGAPSPVGEGDCRPVPIAHC